MPSTNFVPRRLRLLGLLVPLTACSPEPAPAPPVLAVYVSPVRNDTGLERRTLFGSVRPRVEADLGFRTGGKVTERLVDLGQGVRSGEALARLDPADYQLAVQSAVDQQRAAEVDATQAARDAARFERLLADGSVGAADAERQQARADAAAARLSQARRQTELARNRAGYATLRAPFDGVVTAVRFEVGQTVDEGQGVLTLARPGELEVVVDVPQSLVGGLTSWEVGAVPRATVGAPDARPVPLRLRELAPDAHPATRTTRARYGLVSKADAGRLRMGISVDLQFRQAGETRGAELPVSALLTTTARAAADATSSPDAVGGPAVWLVDASTGSLKRQPVRLLRQTTDTVRVAGLPDGALVVTVGAQKLDAGLAVRPVPRPSAAVLPTATTP